MNLQQLEYILAVDEHRHFVKAAEKCCVTQPTLSMMIQKLEDELNVKIFDRSRFPIEPTPVGIEIILRARKVLAEASQLKEFAKYLKDDISGNIRLGVIPTLAPYLLPLFIEDMIDKYPNLNLAIREMPTLALVDALKANHVDIGIMATPLNEPSLVEIPLFLEEFLAYSSSMKDYTKKNYLLPSEIDVHKLWLLEEGHCFRNQVLNFCELKKSDIGNKRLEYEAGSIETLINFVEKNNGITIIPMLATQNFNKSQKQKLKKFCEPQPAREISLVVNKNFPRFKILENLKNDIIKSIPIKDNNSSMNIISI